MATIMLSLTFAYGMDCSAIADLPRQELEGLIWELDSTADSFCKPEENFECTDYAVLVSDYGTLIKTADGSACRFIRKPPGSSP